MTFERVCEEHQLVLQLDVHNDLLRCPEGHRAESWVVRDAATLQPIAVATAASGLVALVGRRLDPAALEQLLRPELDAVFRAAGRRSKRAPAA